jgi:hypothetical protein
MGADEPVHVNEGAAQLERTDGGMVLVFDPDFAAEALI